MPVAISFTRRDGRGLPSGQAWRGDRGLDARTGCFPPTTWSTAPTRPTSNPLRRARAMAGAPRGAPRQRLDQEPRRARRGDRARRGRPRRPRPRATAPCARGCPQLTVLGGCCGTDHRHVGEICTAWLGAKSMGQIEEPPRRGLFLSEPVSRILSWAAIYLCGLPGPRRAGSTVLLGLAPGGVCLAAASPWRRCALTAPFHLCLCATHVWPRHRPFVFCGTFPRVSPGGRYPPPLPCGVRTFLEVSPPR